MTRIQAINLMLSVINEQPVNTLEEGYIEANLANTILNEVSTEIQLSGYWFNTEENYDIIPNSNNEIILPNNILRVDGSINTDDYVQRGNRLYDRENKTYVIENIVTVDIVLELDFEELPKSVQHYITVRAARKFQTRLVGSQTLFAYTEREEEESRLKIEQENLENNDFNMLDNTNLLQLY